MKKLLLVFSLIFIIAVQNTYAQRLIIDDLIFFSGLEIPAQPRFDFRPQNAAMGNIEFARDDSLSDVFVNPAKAYIGKASHISISPYLFSNRLKFNIDRPDNENDVRFLIADRTLYTPVTVHIDHKSFYTGGQVAYLNNLNLIEAFGDARYELAAADIFYYLGFRFSEKFTLSASFDFRTLNLDEIPSNDSAISLLDGNLTDLFGKIAFSYKASDAGIIYLQSGLFDRDYDFNPNIFNTSGIFNQIEYHHHLNRKTRLSSRITYQRQNRSIRSQISNIVDIDDNNPAIDATLSNNDDIDLSNAFQFGLGLNSNFDGVQLAIEVEYQPVWTKEDEDRAGLSITELLDKQWNVRLGSYIPISEDASWMAGVDFNYLRTDRTDFNDSGFLDESITPVFENNATLFTTGLEWDHSAFIMNFILQYGVESGPAIFSGPGSLITNRVFGQINLTIPIKTKKPNP